MLDQGGVVGAVAELGEEGGFVGGEVEADEVVEFGRDGQEEFLGDDQFRARGGLDEDFDVRGAGAVGGEDVAVEQDRGGAEFGEGFVVEFAVVVAGGGEEADLQVLQDAEAEVLEDVKGELVQQVAEPLGEGEEEIHGGLEIVFLHEIAKWEQQIGRHGIGQVESGFHVRVFGQLGTIRRQSGRRISGHVSGHHFSRAEIHILAHLPGRGGGGYSLERDVESGKIVPYAVEIVEVYDAIVDGLVGAWVGVGVCMTA